MHRARESSCFLVWHRLMGAHVNLNNAVCNEEAGTARSIGMLAEFLQTT